MKTKLNTKKKVSTKPKSKALKQGAVVLDFTAGSGTSAIGIEIGRTVILVEKNLNEFEKLKERWEEKIIKTD